MLQRRKQPFGRRKELFARGKELFERRKELFGRHRRVFLRPGLQLFARWCAPATRYRSDVRTSGSKRMIDHLKTYSDYKESGQPWLGAVPASWNLTTLGAITNRRSARNRTDLPLLSVLREKGVVRRSSLGDDENHNFIPDDLSNYRVALDGDLVVNKMKAWQGSVGIAPCDGIVSPAYFVFELSSITQPFAHRLFRSKPYVAFFAHSSDGVRIGQWDLSIDRMKRIPVPVPPPAEQAGIVRFLGAVDRRVNRLVRAKRRLIELLTEQKQAIITHAVTRGLNPNAKRKPSGMDWLGDVPEHWEVKRIKQAANILRGKFTHRPRNDPSFYDGQYPFIQTGGVAQADKFISTWSQTLNERGLSVSKLFPAGTLVMTIAANIGDVAVLAIEACFPDSVVGFVPRAGINRDYLYLVFRCMKPILLREAPVNTQGNLNVERIGAMGVPIPPLVEQERIVAQTEQDTAQIDSSIAAIKREIDLIREYRTRLVADVVTGKLDVRNAAAEMPDDQAASMDDTAILSPDVPVLEDDKAYDGDVALETEEVES
jgi:type I restriction enzyme, S subunit